MSVLPLILHWLAGLAALCINLGKGKQERESCMQEPLMAVTGDETDEETELAPTHMAAATGDMPTYQIRAPTSTLPQGVVMAASPGSLHSPQQLAEEATRKRELRLMKNREAARECRRKKKEYVKCLENRVAVLENQNKTLIEELKALKDLYCHKAEEAAKECRRRKKEYVKCLESRVAVLEVQNKKLIEELETLKDICSSKTD